MSNKEPTNRVGTGRFARVLMLAAVLVFVSVSAAYTAQVTTTTSTSTHTTTGPAFPALNSGGNYQGQYGSNTTNTFGTPNVPAGASPKVVQDHIELFNIPFQIEEKATLRELVRRHDSLLDLMCFADQLMIFAFAGTLFSDLQFKFTIPSWETILCQSLEFFFGGSLAAALKALFNLPFGLPSLCLQGPSFNIGADLGAAFSSMITGGVLGCVINAAIGIGGNLSVGMSFDPGCLVTLDICSGINDLAGVSICQRCKKSAQFWNKVGGDISDSIASVFSGDEVNVVPVEGSGINRGAPYMTHGEMLSASANAKATANAKASLAIKPSGSLGVNADFNANCNLDGCTSSSDGITAGGTFNPGIGFNATAGYGIDFFSELGNDKNKESFQKAGETKYEYSMPGQSKTWQLTPAFNKHTTRQEIINRMSP